MSIGAELPIERWPKARKCRSFRLRTCLLSEQLFRSRRGLALGAIRDHEAAAAILGVDIYRAKLAVYVATAAMTGMIGALISGCASVSRLILFGHHVWSEPTAGSK